jgi:multisubunit Na+/H+ antiporter MnhC subunit
MVYFIIIKILLLILFSSIFTVFITENNFKKIIFLNISQSMLILLYMIINYPLFVNKVFLDAFKVSNITYNNVYIDPLPQALMLTAIVVGFITNAIAIALSLKIKN